jgi:hypothetical protein
VTKVDEYRAHADECLNMASKARDDEDRILWQQMALYWLRLVSEMDETIDPEMDETIDPTMH